MAELSSQTLHIVARELNSELNDARTALEAFGEQQDNVALLRKCNEHLRSVHGALRIAEVYGAALLAEEMGQVARYLIDNFSERRHLAEGLDALMRAMVQLPTYLERVMSGGRDMALVLLPLLNDLRAVRGHALLSEGTLLLLNLSSDQQANPVTAPGEALTIAQWARKLRTRFQLGLLGWIKGERVDQNLEILSRSAERLEQVATTQPVFQLWWVVGAVLEGLREGGLEGSASIKRLLGHADREMKRLYEQGEGRYVDSPPLELLNNLLYYVARARSSGPRVAAVRASFRLTELLPVDDHIEQARESLSAPSVKLMKTVAAAIKEDLGRVKDALDIFVRQGGTQVDELAPQLELLKKIADTLGVLGLGDLRDKVQGETGDLQAIVNSALGCERGHAAAHGRDADQGRGQPRRAAGRHDRAERGQRHRAAQARRAGRHRVPPGDRGGAARMHRQHGAHQGSGRAVVREAARSAGRRPDSAADARHDRGPADAGQNARRGDHGRHRSRARPAAAQRRHDVAAGSGRSPRRRDRRGRVLHGDAAGRPHRPVVHAGQRGELPALPRRCAADPARRGAGAGRRSRAHGRHRAAVADVPPTEHEPTAVLDPATVVRQTPAPRKPAAPAAPAPKPVDREIDPEFLELFIEEAKDEITKLKRLFPMWDENPQDQDSLVNVRRSFHTLKGSGRMVGAQLIGEFAWSVENLLNRVINKTLERSPEMMTLLREAVAAVPELVEQLETARLRKPKSRASSRGSIPSPACVRARLRPPRRVHLRRVLLPRRARPQRGSRRCRRTRRPLRSCLRKPVRKKKRLRLRT